MAFPYLPAFLSCGQGLLWPSLVVFLMAVMPVSSISLVRSGVGRCAPGTAGRKQASLQCWCWWLMVRSLVSGEHVMWYYRELMHICNLCLVWVYVKLKKELWKELWLKDCLISLVAMWHCKKQCGFVCFILLTSGCIWVIRSSLWTKKLLGNKYLFIKLRQCELWDNPPHLY